VLDTSECRDLKIEKMGLDAVLNIDVVSLRDKGLRTGYEIAFCYSRRIYVKSILLWHGKSDLSLPLASSPLNFLKSYQFSHDNRK
jgi:hypothetical protein